MNAARKTKHFFRETANLFPGKADSFGRPAERPRPKLTGAFFFITMGSALTFAF
jgi:hypothetical protein